MLKIELVPDRSHCIETVAKREYREATAKLLAAGEGNEELQERVELLRLFLETTDFKKLRRESERYLVEGRTAKFVLHWENGVPKYEIRVS
jgi:hypothetical protein